MNPENSRAFKSLTTRQKKIARYLAQGYRRKEIASALGIALVTLKKDISTIYSILGVNSSVQLRSFFAGDLQYSILQAKNVIGWGGIDQDDVRRDVLALCLGKSLSYGAADDYAQTMFGVILEIIREIHMSGDKIIWWRDVEDALQKWERENQK